MRSFKCICCFLYLLSIIAEHSSQVISTTNKPVVVATWYFVNSTKSAWNVLNQISGTAVEAVVAGCGTCEEEQCDGTVGFGGSPDENGESTLDALIMDGSTFEVGAVANLRNVKNAIGVAYAVMKYTTHTMLVGSLATNFAMEMGFKLTNLSTPHSLKRWTDWKSNNCQPNYRQGVTPDPRTSCGPYVPSAMQRDLQAVSRVSKQPDKKRNNNVNNVNHDTVGMIAIDRNRNIAAGTSTNGASFKIPGRVGDSPIVGSGAYADNEVGGAAATGDGDIMMRFLPSFHAVELMRNGASPTDAAAAAVRRIARVYPSVSAGVVALNAAGEHGASCHGFTSFSYTVMSSDLLDVQVVPVTCSRS